LNVAVFTYVNKLIVAAQSGTEPHTGSGFELDFADQRRGLCDPGIFGDLGGVVAQLVYRHGDYNAG
jgi:hypothetical protein